jgi:hypothetical protein
MQNKYDDGKSNFLAPKVTQYDGHMVMTNVTKPTKRKFINLDTRYRDDYSSSSAQCEFTLPDRITDVKAMVVRDIEIPITTYNFSSEIGNTYFQITDKSENNKFMVTIPDGQYTIDILGGIVNDAIQKTAIDNFKYFKYSTSATLNTKSILSCSGSTEDLIVNFAVTPTGDFDRNIKRKLGWFLGFRNPSYTITSVNTYSEAFVDYNGLRYLYLVIDEYTRGNQNSFISVLPSSLVSKNILARISMNTITFPFGTFLPANNFNGYLLSDHRTYSGKVDIQKLSVKLVDDVGNPVSLNGLDYSFCLEVEHE